MTVINGKLEKVVCTWQFLSGKHLSGRQTYVDGVHYWASNYNCDAINEYLSKKCGCVERKTGAILCGKQREGMKE